MLFPQIDISSLLFLFSLYNSYTVNPSLSKKDLLLKTNLSFNDTVVLSRKSNQKKMEYMVIGFDPLFHLCPIDLCHFNTFMYSHHVLHLTNIFFLLSIFYLVNHLLNQLCSNKINSCSQRDKNDCHYYKCADKGIIIFLFIRWRILNIPIQ